VVNLPDLGLAVLRFYVHHVLLCFKQELHSLVHLKVLQDLLVLAVEEGVDLYYKFKTFIQRLVGYFTEDFLVVHQSVYFMSFNLLIERQLLFGVDDLLQEEFSHVQI